MKSNIVTVGEVPARFVAAVRELCASVAYADCPMDLQISASGGSVSVEFAGDRLDFKPSIASYLTQAEILGVMAKHVAEGWRRGKMLDAAPSTGPALWLVHTSKFFREWLDQTKLGVRALRWDFVTPVEGCTPSPIISRGLIFADMEGPNARGRVNYNQLSAEATLVGKPTVIYSDNIGHRFVVQGKGVPDTVLPALSGTQLDRAIGHPRINGLGHRIESAHFEGDSLVVTIEPSRVSLVDIPSKAMSVMPSDGMPWAPWMLRPKEIAHLRAATAALAALAT